MNSGHITSWVLLEYSNGVFCVLSLYAALIFGKYIWENKARGYYFIRPAVPLFFLLASEGMLRGPYWWVRHLINRGETAHVPEWYVIADSCLITAALLCAIRIYAPDSWGNKSWLIALFLAGCIVLVSLFF